MPRGRTYRADIDGLRAIAVAAVVVFHAFPEVLPGGFLGVDIFFVISGFLISGIVIDEARSARFSLARFYARRVRRIFPALIVVLACSGVVGWTVLVADEWEQLTAHVIAAAASCANLKFWKEAGYFDAASDLKPLLHLWSLGVEEQFYLVWPLILVGVARRPRGIHAVILATTAGSFLLNLALIDRAPTATFYLPITRMWELTAGAWVAQRVRWSGKVIAGRKADVLAWGGFAMLVGALAVLDRNVAMPGAWAVLPVAGSAALIFAGQGAWLNRAVLSTSPLVTIGLISYPLYLWHWPLLSFPRILEPRGLSVGVTVALVAAAVVLAWLTRRWVEAPFRVPTSPHATVRNLVIAMVCLTTLAIAGHVGVLPLREPVSTRAIHAELARDASLRASFGAHGCEHLPELLADARSACRTVDGSVEAGTLVMWGDSHADAWSPALFDVARQTGMRAVVFAQHGCPPLTGVRRSDHDADDACRELDYARPILQSIVALKPRHVFVTARWAMYANGWHVNRRLQASAHFITREPAGRADRASSRAALRDRLNATIADLRQVAEVTIIEAVPTLETSAEKGVRRIPTAFEPSLQAHRHEQHFASLAIRDAVRGDVGVSILDPASVLCGTFCRATRDGVLLYADDNHLTAQGATMFASALRAELRR